MPGILLPTDYHPPTSAPGPATIREVKSSLLDKPDHAFNCELVAVETTVGAAAAIILYRMPRAMTIFGIDMPEGSFTLGYFWQDRPYNVYHWLDPGRAHAGLLRQHRGSDGDYRHHDCLARSRGRRAGATERRGRGTGRRRATRRPPAARARRIDYARAALVDGAAALAAEIEHVSQAWLAARR